jgi:DNA (cytosine-5)-methyltransferase 1
MTGWQHVSLFAGVGGADLGLHAAGVPTALACEIDKHARAVLAHNMPDATLHDDVRTLTGEHLRRAGAIPERTILSGGFPCQPFSVAGRRGGMGGDDERGDLYWQISRLLHEFPARWIVLENVPGLLSIDGGRTFGTILGDLAELGYGVAYRVLDAQHFGVPQRRRRVFIVGCLGDDRRPVEVLLEPEGCGGDPDAGTATRPGSAAGARGGAVPARVYGQHGFARYAPGVTTLTATDHKRAEQNIVVNSLTASHGGADDNDAQGGHLVLYVKGKRASTDEDDETCRTDETSPTLNVFDNNSETRATVLAFHQTQDPISGDVAPRLGATSGGMGILGNVSHTLTAEGHDASEDGTGRGTPIVTTTATVRRLTPRECERLMGWPDDWTRYRATPTGPVEQADSHRYKQCGNGMAAPVVEWIARRIIATEDTP